MKVLMCSCYISFHLFTHNSLYILISLPIIPCTSSELPYDVSLEEALKHPEVQTKLRESTDQLQALTDRFLNAILQSLDRIP